LKEVGMELIVANDVSRKHAGFGYDTNEVFIIDRNKVVEHVPLLGKNQIAEKIIDKISLLLKSKNPLEA
jgi:phosphopantothenoylcysteine decarboxylase/phosphopantothenate--cysteine ligase